MIIKNKCIIETLDNFRPLSEIFGDYDFSIFQSPPKILFESKYSKFKHFLIIKSPKDFFWDLYSSKYKSGIEPNLSSPESIIMSPRIDFKEFLDRSLNLKEFFSIYFLKKFKKNILDNPKESNIRYIGDLRTFEFKEESLYEFYLNFYSRRDTIFIRFDYEEDVRLLSNALGENIDLNIKPKGLFDLPISEENETYLKSKLDYLYEKTGYEL